MEYLSAAFQAVMTPGCLLLMVLGTAVGIVFGAMPGMSATLAISVFMSIVFTMDNTSTTWSCTWMYGLQRSNHGYWFNYFRYGFILSIL